jgi:tripartite-type tricarboxylate transporter receptor subunit TctC
MPGAGGLKAANYLYNIAAKDGTVIGLFQRNLPLTAMIDGQNQYIKFDPLKFTWLGTSSSGAGDAYILTVRADVPVRNIEETRLPGGRKLIFAGTAPGTQGYDVPAMLALILSLNIKTVSGYAGAAATGLAMLRGEVDGRGAGYAAMRATHPEWLADHRVRILLQLGRANRHPNLPDVPLAREFATNAEARTMIKLMDSAQMVAWPFVAPPGVPADRAAILQKAFMDTQSDPDFMADAAKRKMELSPIGAREVEDVLQDLRTSLNPALIGHYKAIIARTKDVAR